MKHTFIVFLLEFSYFVFLCANEMILVLESRYKE